MKLRLVRAVNRRLLPATAEHAAAAPFARRWLGRAGLGAGWLLSATLGALAVSAPAQPDASPAPAAAPATDHDEWARVEPLAQDLSKLVDQVVNDLSQPLHALTHIEPLTDGVSVKAKPASTAVLKSLRTVLSATTGAVSVTP